MIGVFVSPSARPSMDSALGMMSDARSDVPAIPRSPLALLDRPRSDTSLDEAPCLLGLACDVMFVSNHTTQDSLQLAARTTEDAMEVCDSMPVSPSGENATSEHPSLATGVPPVGSIHPDIADNSSTCLGSRGEDASGTLQFSSSEGHASTALEMTHPVPLESDANSSHFGYNPKFVDDLSITDVSDPQMQRGPGRPRKRSLTQSDSVALHKRGPGRPPGSARKGIPVAPLPLSSPTMTTRSRESVDIHLLLSPGQHQSAVRLPPRVDIDIDIPDVRYIDLKEEAIVLDDLRRSGILEKPRHPKYRSLAATTAVSADSQPQSMNLVANSRTVFEDGEDGILLIGNGPVPSNLTTTPTSPAHASPQSPATAPSRVLESFRASINEQLGSSGARDQIKSVSENADATPNFACDSDVSESEDTDDESYAIRHYRSEMEERVRWEKLSKDPKFQPSDLILTPEQFMVSKFWASYFSHPWKKRPSDEEWEKWDNEQAERQRRLAAHNARKARHKDRKRLYASADTPALASADDTPVEASESAHNSKKRKRKHGSNPSQTSWTSQSMSEEYSEDVIVDSLDTDFVSRPSASTDLFSSSPSVAFKPADSLIPFAPQKITFKIGPKPPVAENASNATPLRQTKHPLLATKPTKTQRSNPVASNQADKVALAVRSRKGGVMTRGRSRKPLTDAEIRELDAEARVKQAIDSTFVWMIAPPSPASNPPTLIRLRRYNVAEVHSHEYLSCSFVQSVSPSVHVAAQADEADEPPVLVGIDPASLAAATDLPVAL